MRATLFFCCIHPPLPDSNVRLAAPSELRGAVKEILYSNGAKAQYAYGASNAGNSAGCLVSLLNRAETGG